MVALFSSSTTSCHNQREFAPAAGRPPPPFADLIWTLHGTIIDPRADPATVGRAKAQLVRLVGNSDRPLRIIVPPLGSRPGIKRATAPNPIIWLSQAQTRRLGLPIPSKGATPFHENH